MNQRELETIIHFRRKLHAHPELSNQEEQTAAEVIGFLNEHSPPDNLIKEVGGAGIIAYYQGQSAGDHTCFRSELDALPIAETGLHTYTSTIDGVAHSCGHDGHMAMLCGLSLKLKARKFKGMVSLLFQPAEETGEGAHRFLKDIQLAHFQPDQIFAIHNIPGHKLGEVILKAGSFTMAVISCRIFFEGRTSHASQPHLGISPIPAIQIVLKETEKKQITSLKDDEFCLITPIHISVGERAYGTSPGSGEMGFTIRCKNNHKLDSIMTWLKDMTDKAATAKGLQHRIEWFEHFASCTNTPKEVEIIRKAAKIKQLSWTVREQPFEFGEDFGLFTEKFPGALIGLGSGFTCPPLHDPAYNFPDELIEHGVHLYHGIIDITNPES